MEPSGSTPNDTTVGKADRIYDPRSLLPGITIGLCIARPAASKKERRRWKELMELMVLTVDVDGLGSLLHLRAYDLYLASITRYASLGQPPPPAL